MSTTYEQERTEEEKRIDADVLARVKRGLEWLQEIHGPGWEEKIDLESLSLASGTRCVLGQVYKEQAMAKTLSEDTVYSGFDYGSDLLEPPEDPEPFHWMETAVIGMGFAADDWDGYKELDRAWRYVLEPRITQP